MFEILYLPPKDAPKDPIRDTLASEFVVTSCESFDDAVSLLVLQTRRQAYSYEAFVAARDPDNSCAMVRDLRLSSSLPLIFLTALKPLAPLRTSYLRMGADDLLPVRKFSPDIGREICAVIERRVLTRHEKHGSQMTLGNCVIDFGRRMFECMGRFVSFTPQEWSIIALLALRYPAIAPVEQMENALDSGPEVDTNGVLGAVIMKLRMKLKAADASVRILSERSIGYRLEAES